MLRQALRQLGRRPGLSLLIIGMLALALGATTATYALYYETLVRPLPVASPEQLVNLGAPGPKYGGTSCGFAGDCQHVFSYPMFRDLETRQTAFAGIAGHSEFTANVAFRDRAIAASGMLVSGGYFPLLGLRPALGRLLAPADEPRVGEAPVVVLSYAYWRDELGADPGVLGQTLTVNGQPLTIVGVAPAGFFGTVWGRRPRVFVPLSMRWLMEPTVPRSDETRTVYWIYAFVRLRPGARLDQAGASINALYSGILNEIEAPLNTGLPPAALEQFRRRTIVLEAGALGQSVLRSDQPVPTELTLLLGATALVLLIACANIANLLLARGVARSGEMALRSSLGASRGRLVAQLLLESGVLAAAGVVASVPVALLTLRGVLALSPGWVVDNLTIRIDRASLLFAAAAALATVVLFGLAPAVRATRANLASVIKGQAPQAVGGRGTARFRVALATAQIALSTLLLGLAGLFTQSLANVARVDLGMNVDSLVSFSIAPRLSGYSAERTTQLFDRIERELAAVPGVTSVASSGIRVIANETSTYGLSVDGFAHGAGVSTDASMNVVSPRFFETLGVPLLAGRDFTGADRLGASRTAIVNQAFVRKFRLGDAPLGKRFATGDKGEHDIEIVGVAADAKYSSVKDEIPPQFFLPWRQDANVGRLSFYVRAAVDPATLLATLPRVIAGIDPNLPVDELSTLRRTVQENVFLDRLVAVLSAGFAALATLLAAIGLYGLLAYDVARRTRELGLRLALGAAPRALRTMVLRQVGLMAAIGIPVGLAAAVAVGRGAGALLYGLKGYDPAVFAVAVGILCVVVGAAAYLPARRAVGVAPMEALRSD
jgi:predicted permease